jgi:hypothetical protein
MPLELDTDSVPVPMTPPPGIDRVIASIFSRDRTARKRLERLERGVGVDGAVDGLEVARDGLAVGVGDVAHRAADLADDAGLHPRLGEHGLDRFREAGQAVEAADQNVVDTAVVQVVEHGQPELGALGVLPPDAEHLALAVDADGRWPGSRRAF